VPVSHKSGALYLDVVSIFFDLFSSGNRHRTEELRRLENTREEEAQGELHRGPIDLNSGTVRIRIPANEPAAADDDAVDDVEDDDSADEDTVDLSAENIADDGAAVLAEKDGGA
jgi:Family of unknown function (DUF6191)